MKHPHTPQRTVLMLSPPPGLAVMRVVSQVLDRGLRVVLAAERHPQSGLSHPALLRITIPPLDRSTARLGLDEQTGRAITALRQLVDELRPGVVHVHGHGRHVELARLARLHPVVMSAWGFLNGLADEPPTRVDPGYWRAVEAATAVLVEAPALTGAVRDALPPSTQVACAPMGLDSAHFSRSVLARKRWRRALEVPDEAFVVLSPRGWAPLYQQSVVFEAFRQAHAASPRPLVLVFTRLSREVVSGASAAEMEAMQATIEGAGLAADVRWLPALRHPMMAGLYAAADVLVSVPITDALPSTLVEAAACELPIIASDLPQQRGSFIEAATTRVPPTDAGALAAAIIRHALGEVSADPAAVRAEVVETYAVEACSDRLLEIYRRCREAPMPPRPKVSVIIATYERPAMLVRAVESALAQTETDRELIVVDDGSTADVAAALAPYRSQLTLIRQENGGLARARNTGLRSARGRFVAFLDDDDIWLPDRLAALLPAIEHDTAIDVAFGDMAYLDPDGQRLGDGSCFTDRPPPPGAVHPEMLFVCNVVPGGAVLVRFEAIAEVGFFDPSLRTAEDYDLWMRISERGEAAFRRVDRIVAGYTQHPGNISATARARMLRDVIRVRERAFDRSPRIRAMHPALLDRRLFDLYLYVGEHARARGDRAEARAMVERYRARRDASPRWAALAEWIGAAPA